MYQKIRSITSLIRSKLGFDGGQSPEVGIVLGSGLGSLVDCVHDAKMVNYADIEGFVTSSVEGHKGRFVGGTIAGRRVVVMQGRVHYYEGYEMSDVVLGVRAMCAMGVKTLVVTNAAGGINRTFEVGDIMLIEDQINLLPNPLIGQNIGEMGTRFPDMSEAYSESLRAVAVVAAGECGVALRRGVYLGSTGPSYETGAEYRFFEAIGADACGMSTTPEVIVARHSGVNVLGFSLISNAAFSTVKNSHADVIAASQRSAAQLTKIIERCVAKFV